MAQKEIIVDKTQDVRLAELQLEIVKITAANPQGLRFPDRAYEQNCQVKLARSQNLVIEIAIFYRHTRI